MKRDDKIAKEIFETLIKYSNLTPDAIDDLYFLQGYIEEKDKEIERLTAESTEWESKYYDLQEENKEFHKRWEKTNVIIRNGKELVMNENTYIYLRKKEIRIDKAIEYCGLHTRLSAKDLLNILEGDDKE